MAIGACGVTTAEGRVSEGAFCTPTKTLKEVSQMELVTGKTEPLTCVMSTDLTKLYKVS